MTLGSADRFADQRDGRGSACRREEWNVCQVQSGMVRLTLVAVSILTWIDGNLGTLPKFFPSTLSLVSLPVVPLGKFTHPNHHTFRNVALANAQGCQSRSDQARARLPHAHGTSGSDASDGWITPSNGFSDASDQLRSPPPATIIPINSTVSDVIRMIPTLSTNKDPFYHDQHQLLMDPSCIANTALRSASLPISSLSFDP